MVIFCWVRSIFWRARYSITPGVTAANWSRTLLTWHLHSHTNDRLPQLWWGPYWLGGVLCRWSGRNPQERDWRQSLRPRRRPVEWLLMNEQKKLKEWQVCQFSPFQRQFHFRPSQIANRPVCLLPVRVSPCCRGSAPRRADASSPASGTLSAANSLERIGSKPDDWGRIHKCTGKFLPQSCPLPWDRCSPQRTASRCLHRQKRGNHDDHYLTVSTA